MLTFCHDMNKHYMSRTSQGKIAINLKMGNEYLMVYVAYIQMNLIKCIK